MKVKNKKGLIITIIVSCILLITAISFLIWHFITLPNLENELKNSPFTTQGYWDSDNNFSIFFNCLINIICVF